MRGWLPVAAPPRWSSERVTTGSSHFPSHGTGHTRQTLTTNAHNEVGFAYRQRGTRVPRPPTRHNEHTYTCTHTHTRARKHTHRGGTEAHVSAALPRRMIGWERTGGDDGDGDDRRHASDGPIGSVARAKTDWGGSRHATRAISKVDNAAVDKKRCVHDARSSARYERKQSDDPNAAYTTLRGLRRRLRTHFYANEAVRAQPNAGTGVPRIRSTFPSIVRTYRTQASGPMWPRHVNCTCERTGTLSRSMHRAADASLNSRWVGSLV